MPAFTSLPAVKAWLQISTDTDDQLLTALINQLSAGILEYLQRPPLVRTTYTEVQSGSGNQRLILRNWPAVSVSALVVHDRTIQQAPNMTQPGYTLETWDGTTSGKPQLLSLQGYIYTRGFSNVAITYQAGYCVQAEPATVVAQSVVALQPAGNWSQDDGVTYANGTPLAAVAANPAAGQYTVVAGTYSFNAADDAASILLNYSYTPAAIEQACIEWVGERYGYRTRIGQTNQSVAGQLTSGYSLKFPDHIAMMLDPYKKVMVL